MNTIRHFDENKEIQDQYYKTIQKNKDEELLDWITKQQHGKHRKELEDLAIKWSSPLGWQFTASITQKQTTPDQFDMLLPYEALPSAGKDISETPDGTIFEIIPGGKFTTQYSRKTILRATQCCSYQELVEFAFYYMALVENNLLKLSLEPGWDICLCGSPIRIQGSDHDQAFCQICDRWIPNFMSYGDYFEESVSDEGSFAAPDATNYSELELEEEA